MGMETKMIPGLKVTYPYEATSPGVARIQCEECGAWERADKKSKGCAVAGQLLHSKRCDSRPQLSEVAKVLEFTMPVRDVFLQRQIDAAMRKFDIARSGRELAASIAQEARRDLLIERGIARAVRGRLYDRIQRGE